jgi:hypothetical protein
MVVSVEEILQPHMGVEVAVRALADAEGDVHVKAAGDA